MSKYLYPFLIIIFLLGNKRTYGHAFRDTLFVTDTVLASEKRSTDDSAQTGDVNGDSLYKPIAESSYLFSDSIRKVSNDQVKSYKLNPDYAYANDPEYWEKQKLQNPGMNFSFLNNPQLRWSVLFCMITAIFFVIYQLAIESSRNWFSRSAKQNNSVSGVNPLKLNWDEMDYDDAIRKYQEKGNYRLAVRMMYLRLIHTISQKKGIQILGSSTNAEITRAFGKNPQAEEFRFLATAYEYIFYGEFLPKQELFDLLKNKFDAFQHILSV